jgi:hypothetical protein
MLNIITAMLLLLFVDSPQIQTLSLTHVNQLTPFCGLRLLEKLKVAQLANTFSAFYGTRRFIFIFTKTLHSTPS